MTNYEALVNLLACRLADDDYEQAVELLGEVVADEKVKQSVADDVNKTNAVLAGRYQELLKVVEAYEKNGVICQTFRHFVSEPCAECNCTKPQPLKLTSDKAAAVNQQTFWLKIGVDGNPLVGTRYQLINRAAGVAHVGPYRDDGWYTHYAGLPKFKG